MRQYTEDRGGYFASQAIYGINKIICLQDICLLELHHSNREMSGLTACFYQINFRQTKRNNVFLSTFSMHGAQIALWLTSKESVSSVQVRTWHSAPLRWKRPLWMLISYSIGAKTASNPLIYLQARADSLSLRLTDALADTFGGWRRRLSHRVVPAVCLWRGEGRGRGRKGEWGGRCWCGCRTEQNKTRKRQKTI